MKKAAHILMFFMALIFVVNTSAFAFSFGDNTVKDIDGHWSEENIGTLKAMGVMNGYMGYTKPDDIITRGEFATLIARGFGLEGSSEEQKFEDVDKEHMFFDEISAAHKAGIIDGFPDNTFRPENSVTREEIVLMLSRITPSSDAFGEVEFYDIGKDYAYTSELYKIVDDGIVTGYPDKSFRPYAKTTRAEAAKMIVAAMKEYVPSADSYTVKETAFAFTEEHFENKHSKASGSALKDSEYIEYTYKKARELGYVIENEVKNINTEEVLSDGPFASVTVTYDVTTNINDVKRSYKGKSRLRLITLRGETSVFEHETDIIKDEPINLTWEVFSNPKNISTPGVNVVSPTSFVISGKGKDEKSNIYTENSDVLSFSSSLTKDYVDYAKSSEFDIWAMYKTDFNPQTASAFLNSASARKQGFEKLLEHMLTFSLDGVNFDFENMHHTDKGAYTNHVKEITLMAHTLGAIVSVDVTKYEPTSLNWSMCYDRDKLGGIADYMALMAYDQYYAQSKTPGPVSGLVWAEECIKTSLGEIPSEKLILGMPYYIRCWKTKNGGVVSSEAISMATANEYIEKNNAKGTYDNEHKMTKYSWTKDNHEYVLWLEDADSIRERVNLSKKYGLAGVASWRRGFETSDVWQVIREELGI